MSGFYHQRLHLPLLDEDGSPVKEPIAILDRRLGKRRGRAITEVPIQGFFFFHSFLALPLNKGFLSFPRRESPFQPLGSVCMIYNRGFHLSILEDKDALKDGVLLRAFCEVTAGNRLIRPFTLIVS